MRIQSIFKLTLIVLCLFTSQSLMAKKGHEIKITVKGFMEEQAFLAHHYGDKQYIKDTAYFKQGTPIIFKGSEKLKAGIYMVVLPPRNQYFEIIISPDEQHFSLETDTADFVMSMKTTNTKENKLFYEDLRFVSLKRKQVESLNQQLNGLSGQPDAQAKLRLKLRDIDQEVKSYRNKIIRSYPGRIYTKVLMCMREPEVPEAPAGADSLFAYHYYKKHYFDDVDFRDENLLRTPVFHNKVMQFMDRLTVKHPDSIINAIDMIVARARANDEMFKYCVVSLLNKYANSKIMGMDAVYVDMVEKYYITGKAWWADGKQVDKMKERAFAISPTIIGRKAPAMRMLDVDETWQTMYHVKKKYTILYFWDYDCGHCKTVTPRLTKLYNKKYEDKNVELWSVSINGDREVWKQKLKEYDMRGVAVEDHYRRTGFDKMYDLRSTPRIVLVDKDKKILAKYITVGQLDQILSERLRLEPEEGLLEEEKGDDTGEE